MEANHTIPTDRCLSEFYNEYRNVIQAYIACRIPHKYEAEDLTQDVFVRLLECGKLINGETISSFLFTIAHNMVTDVWRRYYKKEEVLDEWGAFSASSSNAADQDVLAEELDSLYQMQVRQLPEQRRKVYELVNGEECSITEVADRMNLSIRTVGNHLYMARNEIRDRMDAVLRAV